MIQFCKFQFIELIKGALLYTFGCVVRCAVLRRAGGIVMQSKHNKQLVPLAKHLRKEMTKEERHLWYDFLCSYPVRFSRQKVLGKYIADFYCPKAKLVIELDGSQHYEEKEMEYDKERTAFLNSKGIMVLRFTNSSIHNEFRNVCEYIEQTVNKRMENISYKAE